MSSNVTSVKSNSNSPMVPLLESLQLWSSWVNGLVSSTTSMKQRALGFGHAKSVIPGCNVRCVHNSLLM